MKPNTVVVHHRADGTSEIFHVGNDVEVLIVDKRGKRKEVKRLEMRKGDRQEIAELVGDCRHSAQERMEDLGQKEIDSEVKGGW